MDLLDRYLGAIAALLPAAQREDIVAELRDVLLSRIEDKEAQLGRRLDKKELEALLREFGHPLAVAGRYGPQRALIGVELYPFYIFAVKVALAIAAFVTVIPLAVGVVTGRGRRGSRVCCTRSTTYPDGPAADRPGHHGRGGDRARLDQGRRLGQWKVSDLPLLTTKKGWFQTTRFEALFEVVATVLFILWWGGVVRFPVEPVLPATFDGLSGDVPAPILAQLHMPILLMAIGQAISSLIVVVRPAGWRRAPSPRSCCRSPAWPWWPSLWRAMPLITFAGSDADAVVALQATVDNIFKGSALVAAAICVGKILVEGWKLARLGKR
jgi:hypothetical protein